MSAARGVYLWLRGASPLKIDEELQMFPVAAVPSEDGAWQLTLHGWVYEREIGSTWRKMVTLGGSEVLEELGVDKQIAHAPLFKQRLSWFLVDNERNKRVIAHVGGRRVVSHASKPNGHMAFPTTRVEGDAGQWLTVTVESAHLVHATMSGRCQLVAPRGVTVISDIDDTVKISQVLDRKALVRNIFAHEYHATEGMPDWYAELQKKGVYFHYLSASPWPLYPVLQPFLDRHYPAGSISLRHFRFGDQSFWDFFRSSLEYKLAVVRQRIHDFPEHRFILIGDSGERDPEVYASIWAEFPDQVSQILIRKVAESDLSEARLKSVFGDIPESTWQLFEHPHEINTEAVLACVSTCPVG